MFRNRIADVTKNLLILNIAVWLVGLMLLFGMEFNLNRIFGLYYFQSEDFKPWQLITSMFSHALYANGRVYFIHILFNMFMLYMFGSHVERALGKKRYFYFYMISGFGASIVHQFLVYVGVIKDYVPLVGASGAIFGVLIAFAFVFPNARLMLLIPPIPVKAKILIPVIVILELTLGVINIPGDNVAHYAHLGGGLFGFIMLLIWKIRPNQYYS